MTNRPLVVLIGAFVMVSRCDAQRIGSTEHSVHSCALADSLLGPMKHGGTVSVAHKMETDTFRIHTGPSLTFFAAMTRVFPAPQAYPTPDLAFVVTGQPGERLLAQRPNLP